MIPDTPPTTAYNASDFNDAVAIRDCANAFAAGHPLPSACAVTLYASAYVPPPSPALSKLSATLIELLQLPLR